MGKLIKKFIRGNSERGNEVITELEKLGGYNENKLLGCDKNCIYYINKDNIIVSSFLRVSDEIYDAITDSWEEIKLPDTTTISEKDETRDLLMKFMKWIDQRGWFEESCFDFDAEITKFFEQKEETDLINNRFRPSFREKYWNISLLQDGTFCIIQTPWTCCSQDGVNWSFGNCFKTEQEAIDAVILLKEFLKNHK